MTSLLVGASAIYIMVCIETYLTRVCRQIRENREADERIARW